MNRRTLLKAAAVAPPLLLGSRVPARGMERPSSQARRCTLSFSTYGMKSLEPEAAIGHLAEIGYDAVELAVRPDWNSAPEKLSRQRRKELRKQLADAPLKLSALMEDLPPEAGDVQRDAERQRLAAAMQLAHDLCPDAPPLIQTVLDRR